MLFRRLSILADKYIDKTLAKSFVLSFFFIFLEEFIVITPEHVLFFLVLVFTIQIYFRFGSALYLSLTAVVKPLIILQTTTLFHRVKLLRRFVFAFWTALYYLRNYFPFRLIKNYSWGCLFWFRILEILEKKEKEKNRNASNTL